MKVFTSPSKSLWLPEGEFCFTTEDELLTLWECPCDDDGCSPKLTFSGLESHKASTVAVVTERRDVDCESLYLMFRRDLVNRGWATEAELDEEDCEEWLRETVDDVRRAERFDVGDVVRCEAGGWFWLVEPPLAA